MRNFEKTTYIMTWIAILVVAISIVILSGCNAQVVDLNYTFNKAIIDGVGEVSVKTWCDYDNSDTVQITATDGTVYLTHYSKVILMNK